MSRRTGFTGSALIRLLARWTDQDPADGPGSFADRLSRWVGWTDAIALSSALEATPVVLPGRQVAGAIGAAEVDRVRTELAAPFEATDETGFLPHRRRYHARQHAMDTRIGALRQRLRATLGAGSPRSARLAALDATLEQLLAGRERSLLASVPVLLEKRFEQLRQAEADASPTAPAAWRATFADDMHAVLLAELALRLQPVDGLLAALRPPHLSSVTP